MTEQPSAYVAGRIAEIRLNLSTGENADPSCRNCNEHVLLAEADRLTAALADLRHKYDLLALEVDVHDQANSGVGKPWVGPRRPPEYLALADDRQVERSATCRCCDQVWRWSWIGEDGLCGACAERKDAAQLALAEVKAAITVTKIANGTVSVWIAPGQAASLAAMLARPAHERGAALLEAADNMAAVLGPAVDLIQVFESENAKNLALLMAMQLATYRALRPAGSEAAP